MKIKKRIRLQRPYVNEKYRFMFKPGYIPKKYNVFYGGTGSSKSFTLYSKFIEMCVTHKTFDILIVRKVASTLYDTVQKPLVDIMTKNFRNKLSGNGLREGRDFTYNRTLKHIQFSSGSVIRFKGYDDPEKLKGIGNVNVLHLEEATDFTKEDLEDIQDRLRSTPPDSHPWGKELKVFLSFNPIFKTHWIREYFFKDEIDMSEEIWKDFVKDSDTTFALKTTWRDNKFYNGQYLNKKLRENMKLHNKRKYGVQCNGNWGVLGELIYENWEIIKCIKDLNYYDSVSYGLDFGFEHNTSFHEIGSKDGDIYITRELYKPKLTVNDIIKKLKRMFPYIKEEVEKLKENIDKNSDISPKMQLFYMLKEKYISVDLDIFKQKEVTERDINLDYIIDEIQKHIGIPYCELPIYADNSRPEAIEEMKRAGFSGIRACTKGPNSVLEGIDWLQDRYMYIDESCTGASNEIESYQWEKDKKTGVRLPKPVKVNDDAMDDIRYGCQKFRNPSKFRLTILG